jgi:hypothetical protein
VFRRSGEPLAASALEDPSGGASTHIAGRDDGCGLRRDRRFGMVSGAIESATNPAAVASVR